MLLYLDIAEYRNFLHNFLLKINFLSFLKFQSYIKRYKIEILRIKKNLFKSIFWVEVSKAVHIGGGLSRLTGLTRLAKISLSFKNILKIKIIWSRDIDKHSSRLRGMKTLPYVYSLTEPARSTGTAYSCMNISSPLSIRCSSKVVILYFCFI